MLGAMQSAELEKAIPRARKTEVEGVDETFVPPLIAPAVPARLYFRFGKPVQLTRDLKENREAADKEYANVKVGLVCVCMPKQGLARRSAAGRPCRG